MSALRDVTDEPVPHFIYSHGYTDHVGMADFNPYVNREKLVTL